MSPHLVLSFLVGVSSSVSDMRFGSLLANVSWIHTFQEIEAVAPF